jgi:integrase
MVSTNDKSIKLTYNLGSEILTQKQEGSQIMASVITESNGRRMIQLSEGEDRKRPKIRLDKVSMKEAMSAKSHIEAILRARRTGSPFPMATADWIANLPNATRKRLEKLGLIDPTLSSGASECPTLGDWLTTYIDGRTDVKKATKLTYGHAERNLLGFFEKGQRLDEITPGDVDDFRIHLKSKEGLSDNTIRKRLGNAKMFFEAAVRRKLLEENPFIGQATATRENAKRYYFVTPEEAQAVLDACPGAEWQLVFALARYGGLRCSSEVSRLKWSDINWEKGRFVVHATKTEHNPDGGVRVVPIFEELAPYLCEAFAQAEPGAVYCCPQFRNPYQKYRGVILKAIAQAGLEPWPKLFQNCRSSKETELAGEYPIQVVCKWIGNSPQVAAKHYLQVTEDHYDRAAGKAVQNPVQHMSAGGCTKPHAGGRPRQQSEPCSVVRNDAAPCASREPESVGRTGLEPVTSCVSSRRSSQLS